ncbi:MAG: transcriptional repressor [Treponema sp.]|nr:transcriptional repressor [Treponema sp.]
MASSVQYHTKNYDDMLAFLKSMPGKHLTAQEICAHFSKRKKPMGMTTVYRQLDRLVAQGLVQKYNLENGESACYEFTGQNGSSSDPNCFHCKCVNCGKLIHIECEEIKRVEKHILDEHDFVVDKARTVFYGLCANCKNK